MRLETAHKLDGTHRHTGTHRDSQIQGSENEEKVMDLNKVGFGSGSDGGKRKAEEIQ